MLRALLRRRVYTNIRQTDKNLRLVLFYLYPKILETSHVACARGIVDAVAAAITKSTAAAIFPKL